MNTPGQYCTAYMHVILPVHVFILTAVTCIVRVGMAARGAALLLRCPSGIPPITPLGDTAT